MQVFSSGDGYIAVHDDGRQFVRSGPLFDAISRGEYGEVSVLPPSFSSIKEWRKWAKCSMMQGIIALGEDEWNRALAMQSDPSLPFAMRVAITGANEWVRESESIDQFAYLMGYDREKVDRLFLIAMSVTV